MRHIEIYDIRQGYDTNRAKSYINTDLVVTNKWKRWTQGNENNSARPIARLTRVARAASSVPAVLRLRRAVGAGSCIGRETCATYLGTRSPITAPL